jgi:hypothetical protein
MTISDYAENAILDAVFNATAFSVATPYVALHDGDPGETGANEISGGSYARQLGSFAAASGGATSNDADIEFTGMPDQTSSPVTHASIWDAVSAGNCIWTGPLNASKVVNAGDTFRILAGALDVTLD